MDNRTLKTSNGGLRLNTDPLKAKAAKAKQLADDKLELAKDKASDLMDKLALFVRERPAVALGIGAGAGLVIGKLLKMGAKRRRAKKASV